jgi:hypothetical protein
VRPIRLRYLLIAALSLLPAILRAADISGKVVSASRGEPLGRVEVSVLDIQRRTVAGKVFTKQVVIRQVVTGDDGSFAIHGLKSGAYMLRLNAVGYRLVTAKFSLAPEEAAKEFTITLVPDNDRRVEKVEVHGDIFQGPDSPAIYESNLTTSEIRETSTVLVDDPFRSIQTLPGVSASGNNDFFAQFSVMGASYEDTSIYIDGILVPSPFHGTDISQGATISMFTSDTAESIKLLPVGYPEKYGDSVGAALDLQTREGSRTAPTFRAAAGLVDSELLGEGELGKFKRGSWLASARKSYLGYLVNSRLNDTSDDVSFYDADLKLNYDVSHNQSVSFYGVGGQTLYQLVHPTYPLGPNDIEKATDAFMMGRAGWHWAIDPRLLVEAHGAWFQQPNDLSNLYQQPLLNAHHAEWVAGTSAVWSWRPEQMLEGGWMARRVTDSARNTLYNPPDTLLETSSEGGAGWKNDGYVQQSSSLFKNRLSLVGSLRVDTAESFNLHPFAPQISAALQVASSTQLQLGYGRYHQFDFPANAPFQLENDCAVGSQDMQTADHYFAGVEQRFGENTRAKLLVFDRQDAYSYAVTASPGCPPIFGSHGWVTSQHQYSRGAQIVIQSRTANRLSGWVSYTLAYARESEPGPGPSPIATMYYPTLEDQRNTVNLFANYRLTPTINLGGKFLFGSGFPIPGSEYNTTHLGDYQQLDVRAGKDWAFQRWKLALYGEVLNLTDHYNPRYFYTSYNANGSYSVETGQGLPITPTAGVAFEF